MKAIVTFGVGDARELLELALPRFTEYAAAHNYEILIAEEIPLPRPPSWLKVPAILQALQTHDEVLWLDADIAILDTSQDIADEIPAGAWQALVAHQTPDGEVPNHGVWFARKPMIPVLERIWSMSEYTQHPWWEQAAACELLGYNPWQRPMFRSTPTELYDRTCWLGNEWNSHRDDEAEHPRFWHASVRGNRAELMREMLSVEMEATR
jgi:galactosyl transferase GMA12/MNN10 family